MTPSPHKLFDGLKSVRILRNIADARALSNLTLEELEFVLGWLDAEIQKHRTLRDEYEQEIRSRRGRN